MPAVDRSDPSSQPESDRERGERDRDERGSKQKSSASKAKDLSHVPCKFYKVGSCTAGASCPFSHSLTEPGGQKDVCTWFVKGNCKFGHKCALAHVLPGQSMAMDRKNKKAAQVAAGGGSGGKESNGKAGGGRGGRKDGQAAGGGSRNPLLASTAPARGPGRPPITMPLKASISPSAPAPALRDTDFASFGALDDANQLPSAPAQGKPSTPTDQDSEQTTATTPSASTSAEDPAPSTTTTTDAPKSPSPLSLPVSSPRRPSHSSNAPSLDFGPIGSPPRSTPLGTSPHSISIARVNGATANGGFSPGTSPNANSANNNFLSTSPFSAPGSQSVFMNYGSHGGQDNNGVGGGRSGLAASLGSGLAMGAALNRTTRNASSGWANSQGEYDSLGFEYEDDPRARRRRMGLGIGETAVEDGDMEDFVPSSLGELLTPEEWSRRMSRSNSGQAAGAYGKGLQQQVNEASSSQQQKDGLTVPLNSGGGNNDNGANHRYSRSVPAPSLLGDISSIWAATNAHNNTPPMNSGLPSSPSRLGLGSLGSGTPGSFTSASGFGGRNLDSLGEEVSGNHSMLSPSNASAAFLSSGFHHHYLNKLNSGSSNVGLGSGGAQGRGIRNTSNPLFTSGQLGVGGNTAYRQQPPATAATLAQQLTSGSFSTAPPHNYDLPHASNALTANDPYLRNTNVRPIPNQNNPLTGIDDPHILSPSTRALQSHAPGQSLPQGLAAGYSRIHALPPLPMASPGSASIGGGGFSISPGVNSAFAAGPYGTGHIGNVGVGEWGAPPGIAGSPNLNNVQQTGGYSGANMNNMNNMNANNANNVNNAGNNNNGNNSVGAGGTNNTLEAMFSKLSYSAAASRASANSAAAAAGVANPPTPQRNVSGGATGGRWGPGYASGPPGGPLSPLSGPVVTGDDDDLFSMDG